MAMTKTQQTYALQRLKQIYTATQKELKDKYTVAAKTLSSKEIVDLVCEGRVSLLPREYLGACIYLKDAYDFSAFRSAESVMPEGIKEMASLTARYEDACDLVMLGDTLEALQAVQNFK